MYVKLTWGRADTATAQGTVDIREGLPSTAAVAAIKLTKAESRKQGYSQSTKPSIVHMQAGRAAAAFISHAVGQVVGMVVQRASSGRSTWPGWSSFGLRCAWCSIAARCSNDWGNQ
jgi:hypothetical protein